MKLNFAIKIQFICIDTFTDTVICIDRFYRYGYLYLYLLSIQFFYQYKKISIKFFDTQYRWTTLKIFQIYTGSVLNWVVTKLVLLYKTLFELIMTTFDIIWLVFIWEQLYWLVCRRDEFKSNDIEFSNTPYVIRVRLS